MQTQHYHFCIQHMATSTGKTHCVRCGKDKCTLRCGGCLKEFCFNHLAEHRQELIKQLDDMEVNRDLFRQSLTEQTKEPTNHPLIQQIDKWEHDSIQKIQKTAKEARQLLIKHTTGHFDQIEIKLNTLTNQLRETRDENDFNEINLRQFQEELTRLTAELTKPPNISLRQDSSSFINNIYVDLSKPKTTSTTSSSVAPTAITVKSVVGTETQSKVSMKSTQKMASLMSKLGTTHQQIDESPRRRTERISKEVTVATSRIVAETRVQQAMLLAYGKARSAVIEEEYKVKLQQYVKERDTVEAQNLAVLEKDLNLRQELILEDARKRIDDLNEEANRLKLDVLREAQAQANAKVDAIPRPVAALSAEDANRLLNQHQQQKSAVKGNKANSH